MQVNDSTTPRTVADLLRTIQAQRSDDPTALERIQQHAHAWLTRLEAAKHPMEARQ